MQTNKSCIILAAGDGKRMKSAKPKVLLEVAFAPMLKWVLDAVVKAGIAPEHTAVIIGNEAELLTNWLSKHYPDCKTFLQSERLGTGHAVMQARDFLKSRTQEGGDDVLVLCGDAPFIDSDTIESSYTLHKSKGHSVTVITADLVHPKGYGRILRSESGGSVDSAISTQTIQAIVEEKDCTPKQRLITEVNSGAYWFDTRLLYVMLPKLTTANKSSEYYLTDVVGLANETAGKPVGAFKSENSYITLGANDRRGLRQLNNIAFDIIADKHSDNGVEIIGECYIAKDAVIGSDTTILPNTVIRENVTVGIGCSVGPFAHLRANTVLGDYVKVGDFVEVKNANIGDKSSIAHLSYVGDSDVGTGVNFGCGCVTVNYDGVNKYRTVVEDNAFIGCNTNLIAPVTIGENSMTAAGSTVNKNVPPDSLAIERAELRVKQNWKLNTLRRAKNAMKGQGKKEQ
ncbi:MAG: NTP transferase domain-containing protein [Oscillospiraceae bacterium]|nr:NTP transferase domain-containing protein [Oscillospiraceae bacterium]